jgi:hypothetical protein
MKTEGTIKKLKNKNSKVKIAGLLAYVCFEF